MPPSTTASPLDPEIMRRHEEARLAALEKRAETEGLLALSLQQAKMVCFDLFACGKSVS